MLYSLNYAVLARIFLELFVCERFYRVDKSHSKRIGGTGLGLAIVKHICAICDAELSIESDFGIGTTVTVVFKG